MDPSNASAIYNLAITYDDFYADKSMALKFYEKCLSLPVKGLENKLIIQSARSRLTRLKEKIFFNKPVMSKTGANDS